MDPGVEMRPEHEGAVEREWDRLFESPLFAQGEPVVFQRVPVLMSWRVGADGKLTHPAD